MEDIDSRILQELQDDFPLCEKPYEVIAERLQIPTQELWNRTQRMIDEGLIRRVGASLNSNKLGFSSTLAAVRVGPELVDQAAEVIGSFPEVTHNYLRCDDFNIWFTLIATHRERIKEILEQIRTALSLQPSDVLNLPVKKLFKLDARFSVSKEP